MYKIYQNNAQNRPMHTASVPFRLNQVILQMQLQLFYNNRHYKKYLLEMHNSLTDYLPKDNFYLNNPKP